MGDDIDTTSVPGDVAADWLRRWDAQQERYVADREERFTVVCDVVETALERVPDPVIVDLGCGPGSLAGRLRERLPSAVVIGIDSDPVLLGLARAHYGEAVRWVDADLADTTWQREVPATIHAAVSTTALHWLSPDRLAALYRALGTLIAPGGVLVNGDHLRLGDERLHALATTVRERRAARVGVQANEEWRAWWDAILRDPHFDGLARTRAHRIAERDRAEDDERRSHGDNGVAVGEHVEMLRAAGFTDAAPVWQVGDDHVLAAVR